MSRYLDPLKAEPQEVFVGPNTDPHKVFGRLGIENASAAMQVLVPTKNRRLVRLQLI